MTGSTLARLDLTKNATRKLSQQQCDSVPATLQAIRPLIRAAGSTFNSQKTQTKSTTLTMSSNSTTTPTGFFSLPAELRNVVYAHVLEDGPSIHITGDANHTPSIPLLEAHPLIASEAGPMQLEHCPFRFDLSADDIYRGAQDASRWLVTLGSSAVRNLNRLIISHTDRFTLTLRREVVDGKPTFVVDDLSMAADLKRPWVYRLTRNGPRVHAGHYPQTASHDDQFIRASINQALHDLYLNNEVDLGSYYGHNLIGGLAQFLLHCDGSTCWDYDPQSKSAMHFIVEETRFMRRYVWRNACGGPEAVCAGVVAVNRQHEERFGQQVQALPVVWRPWYEPYPRD
ncbi:hypothetical protein LTR22_022139 [Elasticomyces elasticus]|nr:hypothetical protein LTR22_022139 [Elasticomyces elasticus]KAK4906897.1 hypothetical protein LTR49_024047 [Elasticomyces elasticus]KAK5766263.1 hypothetical protein LTS12_003474 [Elasticomyces elasticus]